MADSGADPMYYLAFDHRGFLQRGILGDDGPMTAHQVARIADVKDLIFDGAVASLDRVPAASMGILVDEIFGTSVIARAKERGVTVALPVERSDGDTFQFQYGDRWAEEILRADPDVSKALVRYNAEGDAQANGEQAERLRLLSRWLRDHDRTLLLEILVLPTAEQLDRAGGERERFERDARPLLIQRAMLELQAAGVEPAIWKIEGIGDPAQTSAVVRIARADGRDEVRCTMLGSDSSPEQVRAWLRTAAATDGYGGFAIGRSIWWGVVQRHLAGEIDRATAAAEISAGYLDYVEVFAAARAQRSAHA